MIHIVKRRKTVTVVEHTDTSRAHDKEKLLALFDKNFSAEDMAQEVLELLAALNHECRIVEG